MIAFFWLQRADGIVKGLSWSHYRPPDAPKNFSTTKIGELFVLPNDRSGVAGRHKRNRPAAVC
jgi:hypothetical protein